MANKWIKHLQQFRRQNKDLAPQEVMKEARKSYQSGGNRSTLSSANSAVRHQSSRAMATGRRLMGGGMEVTPYSQSNLASTASALGQQGGKRRRSQRHKSSSRKSRRTRRR
jgi:hypothetical protein